jgi:energy-coupling factor transporter ATP-binding protein EcfA2
MSRIGELLVREKVLSLQQLQQAQDEAKRTGKRLGATLAKMGMVPDNVLTQMLDAMIGDIDVENVDFASTSDDAVNVVDLENQAGEAPVVKLCNAILLSAIKKKASDIHVEPYEKYFRVRFRIDGILQEEMRPPLKLRNAMTSRLKIMASLDIAERRLPQDGRIKLKIGTNKEMDFRVSVLPTLFGEKIVMRLLDKGNLQLDMTKLGFEVRPLDDFKKAIKKPYGMVLVTGPTGSGKTTTLYSALSELNTIDRNISTAEDPVEFNLAGINQVQMHDDIGLNFAPRCARSCARTRTSSWSARSATSRPPRSRSRPRSPATSCCRPAHQRRAVDGDAPAQHGRRAVPGDRVGQPGARPAPGPPDLRRLQGARREARRGAAEAGHDRRPDPQGHDHAGPRLWHLQQHRLQGPRRALRGHAVRRRAARAGAAGRLGRRAQDPDDQGGLRVAAHPLPACTSS